MTIPLFLDVSHYLFMQNISFPVTFSIISINVYRMVSARMKTTDSKMKKGVLHALTNLFVST